LELTDDLEAPLEQELKDAGVEVKSYRAVIHRPPNFKAAIPILIRHMQMDKYPDLTKNFMAQAIAMKESNPYWGALLELFEKTIAESPQSSFAQGLAVALAKSWKEPELERLIALCLDQKYGDPRILLADGLRRSKDSRAEATLLKLSGDPRIGPQVTKWLKQKSAGKASTH
jgi:hypothetical protein